MFLPDPLVVRTPGEPEQQQDQNHSLKPWSVQRNFEALAQRFPLGPDDLHFGGTVTALPTGVDEGFEVNYIASASAGVVWRFKYLPTTSATYPWLFIGGRPLFNRVETLQSSASTTYAALVTAGPSVALPLAGDYDVEIGASMTTTDVTAFGAFMSYDIGGTGAVDADAVTAQVVSPGYAYSVGALARKTGLTAVTLTAKYKVSSVKTAYWEKRFMSVTPVRVA